MSCKQKSRYRSQGHAVSAAVHRLGARNSDTSYLRAYRCPSCGWWHLTKSKAR